MNISKLYEFKNFLEKTGLVPRNKTQFYEHWVKKFIYHCQRHYTEKLDDNIKTYLHSVKKRNVVEDWQLKQAKDAVSLFVKNILEKRNGNVNYLSDLLDKKNAWNILIKEAQKSLRIRHYSKSTENTYIRWIKRFRDYMQNVEPEILEGSDVKKFLSYLATDQKVSASTQNQAFNTLLFFFRNVLHKKIGDLKNTVRAKVNRKLPVVLTREEVQKIFSPLSSQNLLMQTKNGAGSGYSPQKTFPLIRGMEKQNVIMFYR